MLHKQPLHTPHHFLSHSLGKGFVPEDYIMEVDEGCSVLTATPSSVSVSLHPLVVMNISDHFTRVRMQQQDPSSPPRGVF